MKKITFIHAADLHLDSPLVGLKSLPKGIFERIQQASFQSFSTIVDHALEKQVDFLILAGDLYDGEDRSIRAQIFFRKEMERLHKENIPVYIIHGNHDHLNGNWMELKMPNNVHIFPQQVEMKKLITKNEAIVHLYGFSYPHKHVAQPMISQYEKIEGAHYHIGILHGHDRMNKDHYQYAPFTVQQLLEKNFHYWALGHIHKSSILYQDPYIVYPGNIQGRNRKETGEKGCYYVEMDGTNTELSFIETAPVIWLQEKLELEKPLETFDDFYEMIMKRKVTLRQRKKNFILQIEIDQELIPEKIMDLFHSDEILQSLQEGEEDQPFFVWIDSLKFVDSKNITFAPFVNDHFFQELKELLVDFPIEESLSPIFHHHTAKKYVDPLTKEEQQQLLKEAEKWLAHFFRS